MIPEAKEAPVSQGMFASLRERLTSRSDSEHEQATIRIALVSLASVYLIVAAPEERRVTALIVFYVLFSIGILLGILISPKASAIRRSVGMIGDISITTCVLYLLEDAGAPVYGLYLWVSFGNGFRYGPRYLYLSGALSVAGFAFVLAVSEYWSTHHNLGIGLLIALIVLPSCVV